MKKLSVIVPYKDTDKLTLALLKLSCVEVESAERAADRELLSASDYDAERTENERMLQRTEAAIKLLNPYRSDKKSIFTPRAPFDMNAVENGGEKFDVALRTVAKAEELKASRTALKNELAHNESQMAALKPWISCNLPLGAVYTKQTELWFGTFPAGADLDSVYSGVCEQIECTSFEKISEDENAQYVCVLLFRDDDSELPSVLAQYGFLRLDMSEFKDTASAELTKAEHNAALIKEKLIAIEEELKTEAKHLPELESAYDVICSRVDISCAKQRMLRTEKTSVLTGWVPVKAVPKVRQTLEELCCCYDITEPEEGDDVPVLLVNKKNLDPFEMVIGLYSLPAYGTFDPTFIMSIFYFVIFGLMLGDFIYGLLLTVGGFIVVKFTNLGAGTKRLIKLFAICGIACMISGIIFGSYFGDFPKTFAQNMLGIEIGSPALWFDPVSDPVTFLIVSLAVGALHLLVGMGIKFYVLCVTGHPVAAIFDIGSWYVVFAGIGIYFLNSTAGLITAGVGVLMLIVSQGRNENNIIMKFLKGVMSLYDVVNFVSDLLSYSRIMALGLASAVIASVINILSTLLGPSIPGYILMVVVLIIGNVVNIAINLLGSFVHTSRLQYIEFFGKFFEDGGRPFRPLAPAPQYSSYEEKPTN